MSRLQRVTVLIGLIAVFLCANLIVPVIFRDSHPTIICVVSACVLDGALMAEILLLAIWAALGGMAAKYRLPLTAALFVVAASAFLLGLREQSRALRSVDAIIIIAAGVVTYAFAQIPLWIARAVTKLRIDLPDKADSGDLPGTRQYGIPYLLVCTAVVAALLVIVRRSFPPGDLDAASVDWYVVMGGGGALAAFSAIVCPPAVWLALSNKFRGNQFACLVGVVCLGPIVVALLLASVLGGEPGGMVMVLFFFGLGAAGTTLVVLLLMRALGYRLIGSTGRPPAPPG